MSWPSAASAAAAAKRPSEAPLRENYPLEGRKVVKKILERGAIALFLAPFVGMAGIIFLGIFGLLLIFVVFGIVIWWASEYCRTYFYDIEGSGLVVKKGVIFPNSATIPLDKISDVYADQDIVDRVMGLYDLHFSSASETSGALSHIDGVSKANMEALKAILLSAISGKKASPGARSQAFSAAGPQAYGISRGRASAPTGEAFRPGEHAYVRELAGKALSALFMMAFALSGILAVLPLLITIAVVVAVLGAVAFYVKKEVEACSYELTAEGLRIRKGWLTPSESLIFYANMQDIDTAQGILDRLFGLEEMTVKSMSVQSAVSAKARLLDAADAERLKKLLEGRLYGASRAARAAGPAPVSARRPLEGREKPYVNHFFLGACAGCVGAAAFLGPLAIMAFAVGLHFGPAAMAAGIILLLLLAVAVLAFTGAAISNMAFSYSLEGDGVSIGYDFIAKSAKKIRYEKVQDVKVSCSLFGSIFGIADVTIETGSREVTTGEHGEQYSGSYATPFETIPSLKLADAAALAMEMAEASGISVPSSKRPLKTTLPLSKKKPLKKALAFIAFPWPQLEILAILGAMIVPSWGRTVSLAIAAGIPALCAAAFCLKLWYENEYLRRYEYYEDSKSLTVHKGVFGWGEIVVPFRNVQSVYVDQDLFDVAFGLWDVWMTTVTGESGNLSHIDGLEREGAEELARLLASRVEASRKPRRRR